MRYWYEVYIGDDQEPRNGGIPLTKKQARADADRLYAQGWSVCVVKMVEDDDGFLHEVWRGYWPLKEKME